MRDHDADRAAAHEQRYVERRVDAEAAGRLLVDLRVVEQRVDPLAPAALEHAAGLRAVRASAPSRPRRRRSRPPPRRPAAHHLPGSAIRTSFASTSSCSRRATRAEQRLELELGRERVPDLVQRLELAQPAGRALVQTRVLDRDGSLRGEQLRQLGVLVAEVLAACLLGQIEVPVRDAPERRSARRGTTSSAGGSAGTRPSGGRRRCRAAAAAARPGSGRRGCRARAAGHRSRHGSRRRFPWSGTARAPGRSCRSRRARRSGRP